MAGRRKTPPLVIVLYGFLVLASLFIMALGIFRTSDGADDMVLIAVGAMSLIIVLGLMPICIYLNKLMAGGRSAPQDAIDDMLVILRSMNDRLSMSDSAKRTFWRHRDLENLDIAIHEDISGGKLASAMTLIHILETLHGDRERAAKLREEIVNARAAILDQEVVDAISGFDQLLMQKDWNRAQAEAQRIVREYPDSTRTQNLVQRVHDAREEFKHNLERKLQEAANRDDVDFGWEILKELDRYLSENEAAPLIEIARGVINKKRQNLAVQYKLAVHDREFAQAIAIGDEIANDFPNSQMANEVKQMRPVLIERRDAGQAASAG